MPKFKVELTTRYYYVTRHEIEADSFDDAVSEAEDIARGEAVTCTSDNIEDFESVDTVQDFLDSFGTKVSKDEDIATTELYMDDHKCIRYNEQEYYLKPDNSLYTKDEQEVLDFIFDNYLL